MNILGNYRLGRHLLIAAGLLLGICAVAVVRNWGTFRLMYANVAAMNEGRQAAEKIRRPEDLLGYLAAHPEQASLVAYELGAREEGIFFQPTVQRPMVKTDHLLLMAEYARRVEAGRLAPGRRVPLDSLAMYALPGAGLSNHRRTLSHWRKDDLLRPDSTVALRHLIEAIPQFGDEAAADWFMTALGRSQVRVLADRWGLHDSEQPLPSAGIHLSWRARWESEALTAGTKEEPFSSREAYADRVYRLVRILRRDSSFRRKEKRRLRRRGSGLSVRDQRVLAQRTYPEGTAADYADLLARLLNGTLGSDSVSQCVQHQIESSVNTDSLDAPIAAVGMEAGATPGIISFVGYVRYVDDRPPRVVSLLLEGLPIAVFYHLVQTSLDKGFQLRLLSDPAFFRTVRARLSARSGRSAPDLEVGREE